MSRTFIWKKEKGSQRPIGLGVEGRSAIRTGSHAAQAATTEKRYLTPFSGKLIAAVFVVCVLILHTTSAVRRDYSTRTVTQLIDDLTQIDSQSPGIDSAAIYGGFIADNTPGPFLVGVLGVAPPKVPPQMRELVRRGPLALPELIKHLDDTRPTKLEVGNNASATPSHEVGVDEFMFSYFSDEYDPRSPDLGSERGSKSRRAPLSKEFRGRYTV